MHTHTMDRWTHDHAFLGTRAGTIYKNRLAGLPGLSHLTVEVHRCEHAAPVAV